MNHQIRTSSQAQHYYQYRNCETSSISTPLPASFSSSFPFRHRCKLRKQTKAFCFREPLSARNVSAVCHSARQCVTSRYGRQFADGGPCTASEGGQRVLCSILASQSVAARASVLCVSQSSSFDPVGMVFWRQDKTHTPASHPSGGSLLLLVGGHIFDRSAWIIDQKNAGSAGVSEWELCFAASRGHTFQSIRINWNISRKIIRRTGAVYGVCYLKFCFRKLCSLRFVRFDRPFWRAVLWLTAKKVLDSGHNNSDAVWKKKKKSHTQKSIVGFGCE